MKQVVFFVFMLCTWQGSAQVCYPDSSDAAISHWDLRETDLVPYAAALLSKGEPLAVLIFLGQDSTGMYTLESGLESDASGGRFAQLAITKFDGRRETHLIYNTHLLNEWMDTDSIRIRENQFTLEKMQAFTRLHLIPANLKRITYTGHSTGAYVYLGNKTFTWKFTAVSAMCWCDYRWEFWID